MIYHGSGALQIEEEEEGKQLFPLKEDFSRFFLL
jgi:hypothetical protein